MSKETVSGKYVLVLDFHKGLPVVEGPCFSADIEAADAALEDYATAPMTIKLEQGKRYYRAKQEEAGAVTVYDEYVYPDSSDPLC